GSAHLFGRDADRSVGDAFRRIAGDGGPAGADMGAAFAGGFKGTGPPGMVIALAAAISLLPAIGAAAATLLVLAFGGAFAAIGLLSAKSNKGVQKHMSKLGKHVVKT